MQHAIRQLRTRCYALRTHPPQLAPLLRQWRNNYSTESKPGVMGSLRNAYDTAVNSREEQSKEKIFRTQLKYLSSRTPVNPHIFLKLLDEVKVVAGVGGMKKHLPWVANNEVMKDFEEQEAIIKALTPAEQQSSRPLQIAVKKRVARATGIDLVIIDSLLSHVSSMRSVQKLLLRRVDRGEQLPESSEELKVIMSTSGSSGRVRMPKPGVKTRSQKRW